MFPRRPNPLLDMPPVAGTDREADAWRKAAEQLATDNARMRAAGNKLAAAAIHVATEYDGCHRLLQAASEWLAIVATEGGRPHAQTTADQDKPRQEGA